MHLILFALLSSLSIIIEGQPSVTFSVTPNTLVVQQLTSYKFSIRLDGDGENDFTIEAGTNIIINFPTEFTSAPPISCGCIVVSWPLATSSLTCTLSYNILTISNGFLSNYRLALDASATFIFAVDSITNPMSTKVIINQYNGSLNYNFTQLVTFSTPCNTFTTGVLVVRTSFSPTTTSSRSTMTVFVTPSHTIPQNGGLRIILDLNYTNDVANKRLISQTPTCQAVSNASANLNCNYTAGTNIIIMVINIFTTASNSPFSFTLTPFNNPPTTEPYGSITFRTEDKTSNGNSIDSSTNNKIAGITPSYVQNPIIYLESALIGTEVDISINMIMLSATMATDTIYITTPPQISTTALKSVSMANSNRTGLSIINSTSFQFTSAAWISYFNSFNITMSKLTLPSYAASISSPFIMYVMRNNYYVCQMNTTFTISLTPGSITASLTPTNYQAGVDANYVFSLTLQHQISSTSQISFYFSPAYFSLNSNLTCISSNSVNCTILSTTNNIITVTSVTIAAINSITITISGLTNPSTVGNFTPIIINTYILVSGSYYVVDSTNTLTFFTLTSRPMSYTDFNLTTITSYKVYSLSSFTFSVKNNNHLPANSYIWIIFPSSITITSATCNFVCLPGAYNGSNGIQFQQLGPLAAKTISSLIVYNLINPISTQPTTSFAIYMFDSGNNLLEYLTNGPTFQATIPSTLTISAPSTNNLQNSYVGWFNLTYSTIYPITVPVSLLLITPNTLKCPACLSFSYNSTYTQMIFSNQTMTNGKFVLNLADFQYFYSYEPIYLQAQLMTHDSLFTYAIGSFSLTNEVPSFPSFSYAFTVYELQANTDLIISNITSATMAQRVSLIEITFGPDFNISSINCDNPGYTYLIDGLMVKLNVANAGILNPFSLKNIIAPSNSPSTNISFATYSSNGYLIDQNSIIVWKASCTLPCKTCLAITTQCLSCYSSQILAQSRVLYFSNNLTCVADCGDKYYRNYTTNVCLLCSSSCANCYNFSQCTSCPSNQYLLMANTTCFNSCPTGYFQKSIYCIACKSTCYTCDSQLTCLSCLGKYLYQQQCIDSCPSLTTVNNSINYTCDSCPTNCSTCELSNSTVRCLSCSSGLLDNGACVQSCITYGYVPDSLTCSPCDINCKTCQGKTTFCLSCSNSSAFPYFLDNKCYSSCPNTYYNNNNSYLCVKCTPPCQTCFSYSSTDCVSCLASYSLVGTLCQSSCPSKYYSNGTDCKICEAPCLTCSSPSLCFSCSVNYSLLLSNYTCLSECPNGYVSLNQTCVTCSSNCLTCISVTFCSSCYNNSYLLNGQCYNPCPAKYYSNQSTLNCQACPYNCTACTSQTFCTSCSSGYYFYSNSCISLCLTNQISINNICQNCNSNCSTCQGSINNCTACATNYLFAPSQNYCYQSCPSSLYYFALNKSCLTSCPSPSFVTIDTNTSISSCVSCPSYCTSCISSLQCGGCTSGTYSYSGLCYSACPPAAPYAFSFVCKTCNVVNCQECNGTLCVLCSSTLLLIQNTLCISSCSSLQVYNSINKTCDTIVVPSTPSSSSNSSSSATSSINNSVVNLNFVPMPVLIVFVISAIIIVLLHLKVKLSAIPTLLGVIGPLISLDLAIIIIISFSTGIIQSTTSQLAIYWLIATLIISLLVGTLAVKIRYNFTKCDHTAVMMLGLLHHNALALLTANINYYNSYFLDQHKQFWKKYKLISKVGLFLFLLLLIGGATLTFSISDRSNYVFYSGIQLCILAFLQLLLTLAWIWLPLQPPPTEVQSSAPSEQSTQQISDGHESVNSSPEPNEKEVEESMGKLQTNSIVEVEPHEEKKIRNIDTKSQGQLDSRQSQNRVKSSYQFNQINGVIKVNSEDIEKAIEKGLFRKNEQVVLKQIKQEEEYSKIDDAHKLNSYLNSKQPQIINIFEDYPPNYLYQEQQNKQPIINNQQETIKEQKKQASKQDSNPKSDGLIAMDDEPMHIKEQDFHHNIIFQDSQQDNRTYFQGQQSLHQKPIINNIFELQPAPSLGSIIKNTKKINVKKPTKNESRIISPQFESKKKDQTIIVEDYQDSPEEKTINLFNPAMSRIKPVISKQLSKAEPSKEIIHADFEEILSASDGGSLTYIEDWDYIQRDSSRKLAQNKRINKNIHDIEDSQFFRPSQILRQASIHYQPEVQRNQAPKKAQQKGLKKQGKSFRDRK